MVGISDKYSELYDTNNVAIIGASQKRERFSNKAVRAYNQAGYNVIPVNPGGQDIEGLKSIKSLEELTLEDYFILIYLNPNNYPSFLEQLEKIPNKPKAAIYNINGQYKHLLTQYAIEINNLGIKVLLECPIVGIGRNPGEFPDF